MKKEGIDRLLAFLPYFEDEGEEKYRISDTQLAGPYAYAEKVKQFTETLFSEGVVSDFDWTEWRGEALRYFTDRELIEQADLETVSRLFTVIIMLERKMSGVLAEMISKGVITDLLLRLKEIREEANVQ